MSQKIARKVRKELRKQMSDAIPTIDSFVDFINRRAFKDRFVIALKVLFGKFEPIKE